MHCRGGSGVVGYCFQAVNERCFWLLPKKRRELYSPRAQEVIFVSFFLRPAALKMLTVATAMPALFALQATKIKLSKFHLSCPRGVYLYPGEMPAGHLSGCPGIRWMRAIAYLAPVKAPRLRVELRRAKRNGSLLAYFAS